MNDPAMNELLKWSIKNSDASPNAPTPAPKPMTAGDREALQAIMNGISGASDADLMKQSLQVVENPEAKAEAKHIAFENFLMLIENLDNANNMENLGMWTRIIKQLDNEDPKLRAFAAEICGVAVQNNIRTQERLLICGAIPILARIATEDIDKTVRKTAITALSSAGRNFQAGLDEIVVHMPEEHKPTEKLDANDMDSVDILINKLRASVRNSS